MGISLGNIVRPCNKKEKIIITKERKSKKRAKVGRDRRKWKRIVLDCKVWIKALIFRSHPAYILLIIPFA